MNNFDFSKFISRNDGIKRVQTELFAFHIETHIGYTLIGIKIKPKNVIEILIMLILIFYV